MQGSWSRQLGTVGVWGDEDHREQRESSYVTVPTAPRASRWSWGWVGLGGSSGWHRAWVVAQPQGFL